MTEEKREDNRVLGDVRRFLTEQMAGEEANRYRLMAAFSGGRDSAVLLHALSRLREEMGFSLQAVHVNHGIRAASGQEEEFCRRFCEELSVPLTVRWVDVPAYAAEAGLGTEAAARTLRYRVFEEAASAALPDSTCGDITVRVLLAHHSLDQAETVLMHLLRGSGTRGLAGIRPVRGLYWRPLLETSPEELEAYAWANGVPHVEDESNADLSYTRNRIRRELIPLLQKDYNPAVVETLTRTARLLREEEDYLDSQFREAGPTLDLKGWEAQPEVVRRRRLRAWLASHDALKDLEERHILALLDLAEGHTGRRVSLPGGLTVARSYDILLFHHFYPEEEENPAADFRVERTDMASLEPFTDDSTGERRIPDRPFEKWMDADKVYGEPVWRTRREGDYLMVGEGRQKLQDFFINRKVPRELRKSMLLLADGSHILWVPGFRLSDGVRITDTTVRVIHVYLAEKETKWLAETWSKS